MVEERASIRHRQILQLSGLFCEIDEFLLHTSFVELKNLAIDELILPLDPDNPVVGVDSSRVGQFRDNRVAKAMQHMGLESKIEATLGILRD